MVDRDADATEQARRTLQQDAALMGRVRRGDRRAEVELVKRLAPRIKRMARHMSPHRDEVEDLAQEVLLAVLRAAPRYQAEGCLEAWADVIASRTILRRLRGVHRLRRLFVRDAAVPEPATAAPPEDEALASRERAAHLSRLLAQLPPDQRMALVLKVVLGHTIDEVAAAMGRKHDAVRYLLRQGRARLRELAIEDARLRELITGRTP